MSEHGVTILRLGYRRGRDPRITTHLALVARALGAQKFLFSGDEDEKMEDNRAEDRLERRLDLSQDMSRKPRRRMTGT